MTVIHRYEAEREAEYRKRQVSVDAERHWWITKLTEMADHCESHERNQVGLLRWKDLAMTLRRLIAERTK